MQAFGQFLFAVGALFTGLNFYLSFIAYPWHRLQGGTWGNFRCASGIPLLGSLLLWSSIPLIWSPYWVLGAIVFSLFDTGGIHWLLVWQMWPNGSDDRS